MTSCPTCHGIGVVDNAANPFDDVTAPATVPCATCGPVATPVKVKNRKCVGCWTYRPVTLFVGLERRCSGCRARVPRSAAKVARLPAGICVCGEHLAAHAGVGRCLVCKVCPEFMERGS